MPADGVKGKTWGPSTVHQRSRSHLPLPPGAGAPPLAPRARARHAASAPELPPAARRSGTAPPPRPRQSKSQGRRPPALPLRAEPPAKPAVPRKPDLARKRSGSHDDLLEPAEPRRNRFLCPFSSTADVNVNHYGTVFDVPDRKGKKGTFFRSIRSNSLTGLFVGGGLSSETTELLRDN